LIFVFFFFLIIAIPSHIKRKEFGEEEEDEIMREQTKIQRFDYGQEITNIDPNRRCVDLIVLGISYRSVEADVKQCFEAFGELIFCEVIKTKERFSIRCIPLDQTRC
jgi:hypothetical protein